MASMTNPGPEDWLFSASAPPQADAFSSFEFAAESGGMPERPVTDESLRRHFKRSLIFHGALLLLVIFKSMIFPSEPKPYRSALRVDIVGLPDLLKKDLSEISPSTPAQVPQEVSESQTAPPPAARDQPEPEQALPSEMVLKKKETITERNRKRIQQLEREQQEDQKREKKLQQSLARMKSLAKIRGMVAQNDPRTANGILIKGNRISPGTSLTGDATEQSEASYLDLVREKLQQSWELPVWLSRQNLSAKVEIHIDQRGLVRNLRFLKPSGNPQFDEAVTRTIAQAQPFPKPPKDEVDSLLVHGISLGFPL